MKFNCWLSIKETVNPNVIHLLTFMSFETFFILWMYHYNAFYSTCVLYFMSSDVNSITFW